MTPTLPLPAEASGFSVAIAEKSRVNDVADTVGVVDELLLELELPELLLGELLPQAARISAVLPASAVSAAPLVTECKLTTSFVGGRAGTGSARPA